MRDHRGQRVPVRFGGRETGDRLPAGDVVRLIIHRVWHLDIAIGLLTISGVCYWLGWPGPAGWHRGWLTGMGGGLLIIGFQALVMALVFRFSNSPSPAAQVSLSRVARGRCGSCGYGLSDAEIQEDGCRICTECGAAWRLGDA